MQLDDPPIATWLAGTLGQALLEQERAVVADALEQVFGVQALQVGSWGPPGGLLEAARTQRRALLAAGPTGGAGVRSHASSLAVQADSVDALLLPHTLEFEPDPHAVLREAERVLVGEGHLIVLGFEPLGTWSLRHRVTRDGFPPGLERTLSERRLRDWLKLLAFEVLEVRRYLYAPPIPRLQSGRAHDVIERAGRRFWSRLSGAYLLKARKRVYCMTPIRMRMRMRRSVVTGLASPAAPVSNGLPRRSGAAHLTVVPDPPR
jgi:SAM-dependent methyltransferase